MMQSEMIFSSASGLELVVSSRNLVSLFEAGDDNAERIRRKRCRILVVDDDALFRSGVVLTLRTTYGAAVEHARNGLLALEKCQEQQFHLVLMDVYMRGPLNGIEAAIKMRDAGVKTPVVLMSAYCTPEQEELAESLGLRLLLKPDIFDDLEQILLACCGDDES